MLLLIGPVGRSALRRVQRFSGHAHRPAVDRRHHRHHVAVSRAWRRSCSAIRSITQYPKDFTAIGQSYLIKWPPLPYSFVIFLIFAVVFAVVLHKTAFGRKLYAIGNNPMAARFSGIPVDRIRF